MADGSRHSMYYVAESTYGTTPTDPTIQTMRITGTTLGLAKDSFQSKEIRGDRQISDMRLGSNRVTGDVDFELSYTTFDDFLSAALAASGWVADTPSVGTDQLKAATTRHYFTLIRNFSDLSSNGYFIYRGCEFNQLQLTIAANAVITGKLSVVGSSQEIASNLTGLGTVTTSAPTTTEVIDSFSGTINEGGSPIAVVTELTLTLANGIEPRFVVGSANTIFPSIGDSALTGQVTAYFEDATLVNKFINETESSIDFTLTDSAGNDLKITIPRVVYTGGQPDVSDSGPVMLTLPFQALLDSTTSTNIVIERTPA